ncbi:MAG: hypothetical protein KBD60_04990 [Sterolibacterium sp.]|jgi:tetratricopeptide (TPR) repeat protein|nr:hypothetical protein [Sterolibacterium sp.]
MKTLHWAWAAILADLGLFVSALVLRSDVASFLAVLSLHALCCAILAATVWMLLPLRYRQPWLPVMLLLFCFAFMAPVLGALGVLLVAQLTLKRDQGGVAWATPLTLALPEYDVRSEQTTRASQGAIRSRLDSRVPGDIRMKSLLTLQAVPQRVANPILEELLGDEVDDVRMLAFGMLDAEEKKLTQHIQHERAVLEHTQDHAQRHGCLRRLAELHWELIYASLAQGELRKYMLDEARRYADEALAGYGSTADGGLGGLYFLRARILMAQGEHDAAVSTLGQAISSGLSEVSALPYLAEIAFRQQRFEYVHGVMQRLAELKPAGRTSTVVNLWTGQVDAAAYGNLAPRAQAIVNLWTGRDHVHNFCDHRILNHL